MLTPWKCKIILYILIDHCQTEMKCYWEVLVVFWFIVVAYTIIWYKTLNLLQQEVKYGIFWPLGIVTNTLLKLSTLYVYWNILQFSTDICYYGMVLFLNKTSLLGWDSTLLFLVICRDWTSDIHYINWSIWWGVYCKSHFHVR